MYEWLAKVLVEHADKIPFCMAAIAPGLPEGEDGKRVKVNRTRIVETVIGALIISGVLMFAGIPRVIDVMSEKLNANNAQVQDLKEDVRELRRDVNDKYRVLDQKIDDIKKAVK